MGSIPLPALGIKPVEQPDLLQQFGQIGALKNQQLQGQIGQQHLQQEQLQTQGMQQQQRDQQVAMQVIAAHKGDIDSALPDLQGKVSQQTLNNISDYNTKQKETALKLSADQRSQKLAQNDQFLGLIDQAQQMDPQTYQQNFPQIAAAALRIKPELQGKIDPSKPVPQQQLEDFKLGLMTDSAITAKADAAAKQIGSTPDDKTFSALVKAGMSPPAAFEKLQQMKAENKADPSTDSTRFVSDFLASHKMEDNPMNRQKAFAAFTKMTKTDPGVARMEILMQRPVEAADPNAPGQTILVPQNQAAGMAGKSSASVTVPKAEATYMTSGKGGQQLTAFNTAINHLNLLDQLGSQLNNGNIQVFNKAAQRWATETGSAAPANFAAAKNAMSGEVAAALKTSGATDQEIGKVNETFSSAQSPAQIKGAISTYRALLKGKRDNLKGQSDQGMQGKPNFGDQGDQGGTIFARDPQGRLHQAPAGTALPAGWKQENR